MVYNIWCSLFGSSFLRFVRWEPPFFGFFFSFLTNIFWVLLYSDMRQRSLSLSSRIRLFSREPVFVWGGAVPCGPLTDLWNYTDMHLCTRTLTHEHIFSSNQESPSLKALISLLLVSLHYVSSLWPITAPLSVMSADMTLSLTCDDRVHWGSHPGHCTV